MANDVPVEQTFQVYFPQVAAAIIQGNHEFALRNFEAASGHYIEAENLLHPEYPLMNGLISLRIAECYLEVEKLAEGDYVSLRPDIFMSLQNAAGYLKNLPELEKVTTIMDQLEDEEWWQYLVEHG